MSALELRYNINTKNDFDSLDVEALGDTFEVSRKTFTPVEEDKMITQEKLKEYFTYDKDTGLFTRKLVRSNRVDMDEPVGYNCAGYLQVAIKTDKTRKYLLHRLAWLYVHGEFPKQIDHINHDRMDNRLVNLRAVTNSTNSKNRSVQSLNTSGITGVSYDKSRGRWLAQIKVDYKKIFLGRFKNKEDAVKARMEANEKYGFHENHGGIKCQ